MYFNIEPSVFPASSVIIRCAECLNQTISFLGAFTVLNHSAAVELPK